MPGLREEGIDLSKEFIQRDKDMLLEKDNGKIRNSNSNEWFKIIQMDDIPSFLKGKCKESDRRIKVVAS